MLNYSSFRKNLNTLESEILFNESLIKIFGVCGVGVGSVYFINGYVISKEGDLFE